MTPGFVPLIFWFEASRSTDRATKVLKKCAKKYGSLYLIQIIPGIPSSRFALPAWRKIEKKNFDICI